MATHGRLARECHSTEPSKSDFLLIGLCQPYLPSLLGDFYVMLLGGGANGY